MLNADAWDPIKAQLLGCGVARFAVNELVTASDQEWVAETKEANRGSDLTHMSGIELAQLPGGGPKLFERNVGKLQAREHIVASSMRCRCEGHPLLAFASVAALPPQLFAESCAGCTRIKGIGHWCPALRINKKKSKCQNENVVDPVGPSWAGGTTMAR
jgi:hypothetical protein